MKNAGSYLPRIGRILRYFLILIAIFFIVVFTLVWFATVAGITFSAPFLTNFFPNKEGLTILMMINLLFVVGIPLVAIIINIVRLVWRRKMGRGWKTSLAVLWLVNLVSFVAVGGTLAQEFVVETEVEQLLPLESSAETITLSYFEREDNKNDHHFHFGTTDIQLPGAAIRYAIKKSNDQSWKLNQIVSSRGKRVADAKDLAFEIKVPIQIKEGRISSPKEIPFSELSKWRNQEITLELMVPVGKYIRIDKNVYRSIKGIPGHDHSTEARLYLMTETGLECQNCIVSSSKKTQGISSNTDAPTSSAVTEQSPKFTNFSKINFKGPMKITVEYGEAYDVKMIGSGQDLAELESEQNGDQLDINLNMNVTTAPVRIFIITPNLSELQFESTDNVLLKGFNLTGLDITASGEFELKVDVVVQDFSLEASENTAIEFTGEAQHIEATLTEASRLDTDRGTVKEIILELEEASKAKISSTVNILEQNIDESSSLRVVD